MVLDFEDDEGSSESMVKWPFFASALFIISLVGVFAFLHYQQEGYLGNWQLVGCIFGSALASILIFFPFFAEKALFLAFDARKPTEEEFNRKVFFDLKEMKEELDTLAVKIDKVPSVVDQILSKSKDEDLEQEGKIQSILENLKQAEAKLFEKLNSLELLITSPLPSDPDPKIADIQSAVQKNQDLISGFSGNFKELEKSVRVLRQQIEEIPLAPPIPYPTEPSFSPPEEAEQTPVPSISEAIEKEFEEKQETISEPAPLQSNKEIPDEPALEEVLPEEEEANEPLENMDIYPEPTLDLEQEVQATEEDSSLEDMNSSDPEITESAALDAEIEPAFSDIPTEIVPEQASEEIIEPTTDNELNLDLPDPEETLRKVDALLSGEKLPEKTKTAPVAKEKADKNAVTSVVANVMIGIGNKPFLRGDGPGLNWDEGVPMNFVEIGKWAWSPSRKNATLTVQVYRNDEDPDKGGKYEIKPGEKFEITPDF